jgi:hypothetical protein
MTFLINIDKMLYKGHKVDLTYMGMDGRIHNETRVVVNNEDVAEVAKFMAMAIATEISPVGP